MTRSPLLKIYIGFAIAAALVYAMPVYFFIGNADYTKSWLLFMGNFLFMVVIGYLSFLYQPVRIASLPNAGHDYCRTEAGVAVSFFQPVCRDYPAHHNGTGKFMINKPANTIHDKTNGLDFMVIVNSVIGNFFTGSFITVILAASLSDYVKKSKKSS